MALTVHQTRTLNADFTVQHENEIVTVKRTQISFDNEGGSSVVFEETIQPELVRQYRRELRKDEQALTDLRHKIEDEIEDAYLAALEGDE